jgi:MFS family permease
MIAAVLLTAVTSTAASYANNVCLPYFLRNMDTYSLYAFFAAIASVGMMTALPMAGSMSAKFGSRNVIVFGLVAQFITRVALAFCGQPVLFGILYCLMGFFGGMYMSAPYSVMAELVTAEERPKFFGYITACSAAGALIGPLLTGVIVDNMGPGPGLLIYVIFAIIPLVAYITLYPNVKRPGTKFDLPGNVAVLGRQSVPLCQCTGHWNANCCHHCNHSPDQAGDQH